MSNLHRRFFRQLILIGLLLTVPGSSRGVRAEVGVDDLPLTVVVSPQPGDTLAILLSGDGGWSSLDRVLSSALAERGMTVIGWNSRMRLAAQRTKHELSVSSAAKAH